MDKNSKWAKYYEVFHYYLGTYAKIFGVIFLILYAWDISEEGEQTYALSKLTKEVKQCNEYGIAVTDGMTIKGFKKQLISKNDYKFSIANTLKDYLAVSLNDLTIRSGVTSYADYKELYKSQGGIGGLQYFAENHIKHKSKDPNKHELKLLGQKSFIKFLKKLTILIRQNKLPTAKDVFAINPRDISYNAQDGKFSIKVKIHMKTAGITGDGFKYYNRKSFGIYEAKGYIDEDSQHPILNPNGVFFYDFNITPAINPKAKTLKNKMYKKSKRKEQLKNQKERRY